jgi:hypothetical protein
MLHKFMHVPAFDAEAAFVGRSGFRRQGADDLPIQHL